MLDVKPEWEMNLGERRGLERGTCGKEGGRQWGTNGNKHDISVTMKGLSEISYFVW